MTSIRRHLTVRLVLGTSLLAIAGLLAVFAYLRAELMRQYDAALLSRARTLASLVRVDDDTGRLEFEFVQGPATEYGRAERPDYFQIRGAAGRELARSASLSGAELPGSGKAGDASFYDVPLPDGRAGRAIELRFEPGHEDERAKASANATPRATLVLAADAGPTRATLRNVLIALLVVMATLCAATVLMVVSTVRRGLRPLRDIGDAVARVDPMTLGARFDRGNLPEELRLVAQKLDELLIRLDDTFRRERRFTSNVAHELRTPIAELRSLAEVALRWPGDGESAARNFRDVLSVARQMESVVAALLAIARCQAGHQPLKLSAVDLAETVADAWRPHAGMASARGLVVEMNVPAGVMVSADRAVLTAMLQNLLANAVSYTPAGGRLSCCAVRSAAGETISLEIVNTNRTLTPDDLPLLTEPFWRKDAARTSSTNSGLGLTLVATYAKILGARFGVSLPSPELFATHLEIASAREAGVKSEPEHATIAGVV